MPERRTSQRDPTPPVVGPRAACARAASRGLAAVSLAALSLAFVAGCRNPPAPAAPPLALLGWRSLARAGASTGAALPTFDVERLPMLRSTGDLPVGWSMDLVDGSGNHHTAHVDRLERPPATILRMMEAPDDLAPGLGEVRLVASERDGAVVQRWPVFWSVPPEALPALQPVVAHRAAGRLAEARQACEAALAGLPPGERHWGLVESARIAQQAGASDDAIAAWELAAEAAAEAGVPTEASRRHRAAAHIALLRHRFAEARSSLEAAERAAEGVEDPVGAVRLDYLDGLLRRELGDFRAADQRLARSAATAWTYGLDTDWAAASDVRALLMQELGQHGDAWELTERVRRHLESNPLDPRMTAYLLNNRAWIFAQGMAEGARPADWPQARALFEEALGALRAVGDPEQEADTVVNLAWVARQAGEPDVARARLDAAAPHLGAARANTRLFAALLDAELRLDGDDPAAALQAFVAVEAQAREGLGHPVSETAWRARYGAARARRALGDEDGALAALLQALDIRERVGRHTELQSARAPFFADRRGVVDDTLRLMLARGDAPTALAVATAEQTRVLRSVEARARVPNLAPDRRTEWERRVGRYRALRDAYDGRVRDLDLVAGPARAEEEARLAELREDLTRAFDDAYALLDEVAPATPTLRDAEDVARLQAALGDDEALVAFTALGGGWHAFLVTRGGLEERPVADPADPLAPWAERLGERAHVFVVPGGLPAAEDVAARPCGDGRILLEHVGLSWLPDAGTLLRAGATAEGRPLVVADPRRDLPHAAREGEDVARALTGGVNLLQGDAATRDAVLAALDGASVFHFAGHGVLTASDPWAAHLQLADGETLTLADLLAARTRPGVVVLSGCRTGRTAALSRSERIGLPAAFLLAGALAVVAADRDVDDAVAREFVLRFYEQGGARRPGPALRAVALAMRREGSASWDAFRLIGRP